MFRIMLQKMWHKKWMVLRLLIGNVLLIATVVSFPLYRTAAFDRMLRDEFEQELTENGKWPAMLEMAITAQKDGTGQTITGMENFVGQLCDTLGVTKRNMIMNAITTQKEFISGFDLAVLRVCSDFIKYSYTHSKNILLFEVLSFFLCYFSISYHISNQRLIFG